MRRYYPMNILRALSVLFTHLGHVREPLHDCVDSVQVSGLGFVRHAVVVHDLCAPQLVVGSVHCPPEYLQHTRTL